MVFYMNILMFYNEEQSESGELFPSWTLAFLGLAGVYV